MKTKLATLVSTMVLASCDPGMVGNATLCDEALGHLSACGITAQGPAQCDVAQEEIATEILGRDCTGLTDRSTFSGSSCGFLSWLFGNCNGGKKTGKDKGGTGWSQQKQGLHESCVKGKKCGPGLECHLSVCFRISGESCRMPDECRSNECPYTSFAKPGFLGICY